MRGLSDTICSRSFHSIRCDFVALFHLPDIRMHLLFERHLRAPAGCETEPENCKPACTRTKNLAKGSKVFHT
jgi:hypothetical protein